MPSRYTHYRFGAARIKSLPDDARKAVTRFRRLYDMGLHGPDLFMFYNPAVRTRTGDLAGKFHEQSGREFFGRICRHLRLAPTEAGLAYLYGVLCHYALDSECHPWVEQMALDGPATHSQIETEFDRYLLETDGKTPAHTQDVSAHMRLTPGECATVAEFYPPARAGHIKACVRNMAFFTRLFAMPEGPGRDAVTAAAGILGETPRSQFMAPGPDERCVHLNEEFLAHYRAAEAAFPLLLKQLRASLKNGTPLGADFERNFG